MFCLPHGGRLLLLLTCPERGRLGPERIEPLDDERSAASESEPAVPETGTEPGPAEDKPVEVDWRAKAREWERRAKANAAAAKKLAEIEDASKSEAQRSAEKIGVLEARVAEFEAAERARGWAAQVSKATGVPADLLRGASLEEVEAHAEAIRAALGPGRGPVVPNEGTGRPSPASTAEAFAAFIEDKLNR